MAGIRAAGALALLVLVTACGGATGPTEASETRSPTTADTATSTSSAATTEASAEPSSPVTSREARRTGVRITTGASPFGTMVFDGSNQAIYIWELEPTTKPQCYGDCAVKWPPVLTDGEPVASSAVRQRLLGTTERRDGSLQVTYNDHPLYYYADEPPGAVECHDISTHGGLWWVIQPDGDRAA